MANRGEAGTNPGTGVGNGDIIVNQAVSWTASGAPTTLTFDAFRDVDINYAITATGGNFKVCCGRDINVDAAITTTRGSLLLNAGRNLSLDVMGALTTTDGNMALCAGVNVNLSAAVTLTRGSMMPAESLGLPLGLSVFAGTGGTGPGIDGGTFIIAAGAPKITVTGPDAPVSIDYNPVSYTQPTDYKTAFTLTQGASLVQHMLVFPEAVKLADGNTQVQLSGFEGTPAGVTLVAGAGAKANFDSSASGQGIGVSFSGYSLGGPNAAAYALAENCCTSTFSTTGTITATATPASTATGADGSEGLAAGGLFGGSGGLSGGSEGSEGPGSTLIGFEIPIPPLESLYPPVETPGITVIGVRLPPALLAPPVPPPPPETPFAPPPFMPAKQDRF